MERAITCTPGIWLPVTDTRGEQTEYRQTGLNLPDTKCERLFDGKKIRLMRKDSVLALCALRPQLTHWLPMRTGRLPGP